MEKVVLLHGALGSKDQFKDLAELLSLEFEVYTLNFSGHGGQVFHHQEFSIHDFAKEVLQFLDQNKIESTSIFGYSMGGYVAFYLATHFPERIKKVFTLATKFHWTIENSIQESKLMNASIIKEKVPKYATTLEQLHGDSWVKLMNKTAELILDLGANAVLKEADFKNINVPILLGVGDNDVMVSLEETIAIYRFLLNGQLLIFPNTTHPINRIDLESLYFQIKNFFQLTVPH